MSVNKEDADVILLEQRFHHPKSECNELGLDAELIVLDSVESSSGSSVEEIVPCNDDSPIVCFTNANDKCALNSTDEVDSHLQDENFLLLNEVNRLKEDNKQLQDQLEDLRRVNDVEKPFTNVHKDTDIPHVQVIFRTEKLAKKYRHRVSKFLKKLLPKDLLFTVIASPKKKESTNDESVFYVDTQPLSEHKSTHRKIPSYESSFQSPMQKELEVAVESKKFRTSMCFNCQGDHILSKCPEPWNQDRINENKKIFFKSNMTKSPRYHVEKQISEKYRPGEISEELRSALSLKPNQVPPYIYRMRSLGYPPGWMKEAVIESSGITIYDSEGKAVADDNVEDGEVDTTSIKVQYDPKKLVSYPGFNVPLPPGVVDESAKMGFPPMQYCHLRSEVEKNMKPPEAKAYRKRKMSPIGSQKKKARLDVINRKEDDMEIESCSDGTILNLSDEDAKKCTFVPPLPPDNPEKPPPPPADTQKSSDTDDGLSVSSAPCDSPSLNDLEDVKYKLMQELDQVSDEGTSSEGISSPRVIVHKPDESPSANSLPRNSESNTSKGNLSLYVNPGTPVLVKHSRFSNLPDSSRFAKDVSEHLCFENLPDSTGQYERMRQLIGKIQNFQKQHQ